MGSELPKVTQLAEGRREEVRPDSRTVLAGKEVGHWILGSPVVQAEGPEVWPEWTVPSRV